MKFSPERTKAGLNRLPTLKKVTCPHTILTNNKNGETETHLPYPRSVKNCPVCSVWHTRCLCYNVRRLTFCWPTGLPETKLSDKAQYSTIYFSQAITDEAVLIYSNSFRFYIKRGIPWGVGSSSPPSAPLVVHKHLQYWTRDSLYSR